MAVFPQTKDLHARVADLLAIPSILSYSRVLSMVEELASSPPVHLDDDAAVALLHQCDIYATLCHKAIRRLRAQDAVREREAYRAASQGGGVGVGVGVGVGGHGRTRSRRTRDRRRGVVFGVDKGEHVASALEALRLEQFLEERESLGPRRKKVRFVDVV
ncbi:hypothetical protein SAMD00023353_3800120 [Rosellinia necatrix]|uniref:Uncharacterized protein n=1 Tax=Rosellinia necatrix TaxID=77044 RepID=A0A1W2TMD7_ROSNE|nr:hypothetical protein SAMD00023353_3800120 [Rosellinia necatrix]